MRSSCLHITERTHPGQADWRSDILAKSIVCLVCHLAIRLVYDRGCWFWTTSSNKNWFICVCVPCLRVCLLTHTGFVSCVSNLNSFARQSASWNISVLTRSSVFWAVEEINPHGSTWARGAGDDELRIRQDAQVFVQLLLTQKNWP